MPYTVSKTRTGRRVFACAAVYDISKRPQRAGRPTGAIDVREDPRHRAHRLSRRRQDDAAEPHPQRGPRPEVRRHRQRIRRDRHRQRPRRRRRRGSVRNEQRLHLLHRARRSHPHHRGADEAQGQVRRDHRRDDGPRRSGARWRRPSSSIRTCRTRHGSTPWSRSPTPNG